MNRVIDHVHAHLARPLRLEELAKVACFSPFHFHRVFKSVTGAPLNAFVKRLRLERALYLMSHTEKSLTEIALEVGFYDHSDFSRQFRRFMGVSPTEYRVQGRRARG
ncbi:MAG: helix-turn-helix transcriptional regulator [Myxococcales bacterium]|nr:helix-turn-helix transcriptional regulator [Myxococcales bacterium]